MKNDTVLLYQFCHFLIVIFIVFFFIKFLLNIVTVSTDKVKCLILND